MSDGIERGNIEKALMEFHQFLSDLVPPLIVADSITLLLPFPQQVAAAIQSWITTQTRLGGSVPISDYLYHGVMKIHMMQEYNLIPKKELEDFLEKLKLAVLEYCPVEDRKLLQQNLDQMGSVMTADTSKVEVLFRQASQDSATATLKSGKVGRQGKMPFRRFGLLLKRLERRLAQGATPAIQTAEKQEDIVSAALAEAARSANAAVELTGMLNQFQNMGVHATSDDIFRALGRNVPGWSLPSRPDIQIPEDSNLTAMRSLIQAAVGPEETASRFRQLVSAAVECFNGGNLAQAASMIDLAERIISELKIDGIVVDQIRSLGDRNLDSEKLRVYAETPDQHYLLQRVLNFYTALSPAGLLDALGKETRREGRRLILLYLECHGEPARKAVLERLKTPLGRDPSEEEIYFRRNLVYMLRHIPMSEGESVVGIVDLLLPLLDLRLPSILLKEVLAYLPQLTHEKTARGLEQMLKEIEVMLSNPKASFLEASELLSLLDRVTICLCRLGIPSGRKAAIAHAIKKKSEYGDTISRITELSTQNLKDDSESLESLFRILDSNLPLKVLGIYFRQRERNVRYVLEALSGTPIPRVRRALEEIQNQYPDREAGRTATKILPVLGQSSVPSRPFDAPKASLMGDVDLFGLPALLQSFADSKVSGTLVLKDQTGEVTGTLTLERGKLSSCRRGSLFDESGFYQLLEDPQPGTFQFTRSAEDSGGLETDLNELLPLIMEGFRRYDEVQQTRAIVPDESRFKVLSSQPPPLPDETDGLLFRDLWTMVQKGASVQECDTALTVDSYRIRRLLVHWVESGAIEVS